MQQNTEMTPAPATEMVRYLALFHRAFGVIAAYKENRNPNEALLGGYLADALHNVPGILQDYDEQRWHSTGDIEKWVRRGLPQMVAGYGAPEAIITLCSRVISPEGTAAELGLSNDLSNLDMAPQEALDHYLTLLYSECLEVRTLRNHGNKGDMSLPPQERQYIPWHDLEIIWTEEANEGSLLCAYSAQALLPVIAGLVRWNIFDEQAWQRETKRLREFLPERFRKRWESQFRPRLLG
jgi:hypothetical protein